MLHDRLSALGAEAIIEALAQLNDLQPVEQPDEGVTYASKIDKAEARVDWARPARELDHLVRGLSPFPGAWCEADGERLKLLQSRVSDGALDVGEVSLADGRFLVGTGEGVLEILQAQRAGKRAAPIEDLLKGWTPPARLT
jgi:methionyl-tRNA formyltransferase